MNLLKILGAIFAFAVLAVADAAETNWLGVGKTKIDAVEAMLSDANRGLSRPVSDRAFWERYPASSHIRRRAEQHRTGKVPELDATKPYDLPGNLELSRGICCMTIMEAKENRGRYLPQLTKYLERRINQPAWTTPDLGIARAHGVDLHSARQIRDLAEVDWILGEKLSPEIRRAIRDGLQTWCFDYMLHACSARKASEIGGFNWLRATTNWNPFCWIGVLHAADVMLPKRQRAILYANAQASLRYYTGAFSEDGYIVEGAGYYDMGFSRFLDCAELLRRGTSGKLDLLAPSAKLEKMMLYPLTYAMDHNLYPHFADSGSDGKATGMPVYLLAQIDYLSNKANFKADWQNGWPAGHGLFLSEDIGRQLLLDKIRDFRSERRDTIPLTSLFRQPAVLVCRDDASGPKFSFAAKGGHNFEDHNHNDLGSFCIGYDDRIVLGDLGYPQVGPGYFNSGRRYEWKLASSWGHPVPVVNECLQGAGRQYRADILQFKEGPESVLFRLDLTKAYPEKAGLKKLVRTFQWNRGDRTLKVIDEFQLKKPGTFSAALVGFSPFVNLKENYGENDSLQFQIETNVPGLTVSAQEIPERSQNGKKIPWRLEYGSSVAVLQGKYQVKIALKQL
ncbi:hypothetical protein [uncultured Victivallis sp.]|uniref:hypothetical protein n=1 Tax=uncultured Victivallis sp. TaxID=354118 RepID=UPI0025DB30B3|nr:hypothetical protein [uncultured Victivallis sp.]